MTHLEEILIELYDVDEQSRALFRCQMKDWDMMTEGEKKPWRALNERRSIIMLRLNEYGRAFKDAKEVSRDDR